MKILIITQDEPIYIAPVVKKLINQISFDHEIVGCVVLLASASGKKEAFYQKALKIFYVFGFEFFVQYAIRFVYRRLFTQSLSSFLKQKNVLRIKLEKSINHDESLKLIQNTEPDVLISLAGNEIFKKPLIELAPKGCLNLHTGLLPKYRGLMPTFWALKNNEKEIGVSVFYVDTGIDSGPIAVQKKLPIRNRVQSDLIKETKEVGIDCILEAVSNIKNDSVVMQDNDDSQSTYYGFPTSVDVAAFKKSGAKFF